MRIGLYGMPGAGKSHLLERIPFLQAVAGSRLLRELDPEFDSRDEAGREKVRKAAARLLRQKDPGEDLIMDGHYAFGGKKVFTEEDGQLYDVFLYLYLAPDVLKARMEMSEKNRKYLEFDVAAWQDREIAGLRQYCHEHEKDFYVIDNPPEQVFGDVADAVRFIREIVDGYSCVAYAGRCAEEILGQSRADTVTLLDGDRTLVVEDSSRAVLGYRTHVFDGDFYTGYQVWRQNGEFEAYQVLGHGRGCEGYSVLGQCGGLEGYSASGQCGGLEGYSVLGQCRESEGYPALGLERMPVRVNERVRQGIVGDAFLLTSGHEGIWGFLSKELGIPFYGGRQMAAETKLYITKLLQRAGKRVIAYGDSMGDYFMLRQADQGYLVRRPDGTVSGSLRGKDMEGLDYV